MAKEQKPKSLSHPGKQGLIQQVTYSRAIFKSHSCSRGTNSWAILVLSPTYHHSWQLNPASSTWLWTLPTHDSEAKWPNWVLPPFLVSMGKYQLLAKTPSHQLLESGESEIKPHTNSPTTGFSLMNHLCRMYMLWSQKWLISADMTFSNCGCNTLMEITQDLKLRCKDRMI